jgi:hypothetical protein
LTTAAFQDPIEHPSAASTLVELTTSDRISGQHAMIWDGSEAGVTVAVGEVAKFTS